MGLLFDMIVRVSSFIFLADYVILDCEIDSVMPSILGRSFIATGIAMVDIEKELKFIHNSKEATFNFRKSMK